MNNELKLSYDVFKTPSEDSQLPSPELDLPCAILILGMAGSGKSTFLSSYYTYLSDKMKKKVYTINLDPAASYLTFKPNVDIRDAVKYRKIMNKYNLGPNGTILTCLNLFATKFDQVIKLIEKRRDDLDYILIDTPGQIEVFNWSASGMIISSILSTTFPTVAVFLHDTSRCERPATLLSSLLYSVSISCRTNLPFLNILTKCDIVNSEKIMSMINDPLVLAQTCEESEDYDDYGNVFAKNAALQLCSFYRDLAYVNICCLTGENFDLVRNELTNCLDDYYNRYLEFVKAERLQVKKVNNEKYNKEFEKFSCDKTTE